MTSAEGSCLLGWFLAAFGVLGILAVGLRNWVLALGAGQFILVGIYFIITAC